ncbi:AAA family ATPase [Campylobacter coli]|nr:bacteriocin [Campylobacter coli]EAK0373041.1 bacteriocin [Campylobacter jejuni]ECL6414768.1 AAA family ATPase [Campylobacter coli]EGK8164974.1 AAA family ATPase [Campylobacter coli]EHL3435648.1 AAA family ATPase [Campylobacter coli]
MELVELTKKFLNTQNISQNNLSDRLGINKSYMVGYMKEGSGYKYASKVEPLLEKYIKSFVEEKSVKELQTPFIATKDAKAINVTIESAMSNREMGVIIGEAGTGKSRAIKEYAAKNGTRVVLFEATTETSKRMLLVGLENKLNICFKGSLDDKIRGIASELARTSKVLIIDESEHLPFRALECLRRIYDFSNTALILVGTRKLKNNLTGIGRNDYNEYGQLSSRIGAKWELKGLCYQNKEGLKDEDLKTLCKHFDVEDKKAIDLVFNLARGNFRKSEKLLKRACEFADGKAVELKHIEAAASFLMLG